MKTGLTIIVITPYAVDPVIPGEHGVVAEYVLLNRRDEAQQAASLGHLTYPAGVEHTLEFEIMPGSKTGDVILAALGMTKGNR